MKRKYILQCFLVTTVVVGLLYTGLSQAQLSSAPDFGQDRANIGFGVVTSDEKVLELLQRYDVVPQAVFMWTHGFSGTHRAYKPMGAQEFLQDMRVKVAQSFAKNLEAEQFGMQRYFLEKHTEGEVIASDLLQTRARSILNRYYNLTAGLAAIKRGESLIYAVEVSGDKANIERLVQDKMVKAFELAREEMRGKVPRTPTPEAYNNVGGYNNPQVQATSTLELYRRIAELAATIE